MNFRANAKLEYVIHKTDEKSAAVYTCVASNQEGTNHDSVTVNIKGILFYLMYIGFNN